MKRIMGHIAIVFIFTINLAAQTHWYKGNTHSHTLNSDGDSSPIDVVKWYRTHGYHFLVLTDHNLLTPTEGLNSIFGMEEKFLVIPGDEVSANFKEKAIHLTAIGIKKNVLPHGGKDVVQTIQNNITAINKVGGISIINHPNFLWSITADDLSQVHHCRIFELFNGHPKVNNWGGVGIPSTEEMWDILLTKGQTWYAVSSDDVHHLSDPWDQQAALPGRGWIYVKSEELSVTSIMDAIKKGDFYASTGVTLKDIQTNNRQIKIDIKDDDTWAKPIYRVQFIGKNGTVLEETKQNPAIYKFKGNESYVRVKITDSNGKIAWTQPVFMN